MNIDSVLIIKYILSWPGIMFCWKYDLLTVYQGEMG